MMFESLQRELSKLFAKGVLYLGLGSNRTVVEQDGTLKFEGNATVWDDIRINPGSFDRPGASDPSWVSKTPGGGTTTYLLEFAKNNIASFTVQLPHSYKVGSDIYVHIHWTPVDRGNEEAGASVGWKIDYTWASINEAFGAMTTLDLSDTVTGTDFYHEMTSDVVISGTGKGISSMLICNLKRTDTGADDTWTSNVGGQQPCITEVDFHFEIDTVGSRERISK